MQRLIYYPSFEPPNNTWLKFALLYFEHFKPIVPQNRQYLLSDNLKNIIDNSDLIELYSPSYNDGCNATIKTIEEAKKFINEPYERSYLFKKVNILRDWRNPVRWTYKIYSEKFSLDWVHFCREYQLGDISEDGIFVSEDLAYLFMTYLAKEIAFSQEAAIITDNYEFDAFTNYYGTNIPWLKSRSNFAKAVINLVLPQDLSHISFDTLLEFRKNNRELLSAFNKELDNVQIKISDGYSGQDFIDDYNKVYKEFSNAIAAQAHGIVIVPLSTYMLINNNLATTADYIKEIIGSLGIIYSGLYSIKKGLKDSKTKRYCKKYITNLKQVS